MNKVILKQQEEKKEEKQEEKQKKKEKQQPLVITQPHMEERLFNHFQHHIGKRNKTTLEEVFQVAIGVSPYQVDSYARYYWIEVIKRIMCKLRRENKVFIIKEKGDYYVLQTPEESAYYKKVCSSTIEKLERAKVRADNWVENELWKNMPERRKIIEERLAKKKTEPKTTDEKIEDVQDVMEKVKTKVVKLYEESE